MEKGRGSIMTGKITCDALLFWATIDPVGTVVLFAALTAGMQAVERRMVALRAVLYAALILVGSVVLGQIILTGLGIRLISLQVAGGVVLFLFGLQMIFRNRAGEPGNRPEAGHELASWRPSWPPTTTCSPSASRW